MNEETGLIEDDYWTFSNKSAFEMEESVPEKLGLQIFGDTEFTVDITVSGKRFVLQTLDSSKFNVTAQTNYVVPCPVLTVAS